MISASDLHRFARSRTTWGAVALFVGATIGCANKEGEVRAYPIVNPSTGGGLPSASGGAPQDALGSGGGSAEATGGMDALGGATSSEGGGAATGASGGGGATDGYSTASGGAPPIEPGLAGAPMVVLPTKDSFGVNAVYLGGPTDDLVLRYKSLRGGEGFVEAEPFVQVGSDTIQWNITGLSSGTTYLYEIVDDELYPPRTLFSGRAVTQRDPGASFDFVLLTDTHIQPKPAVPGDDGLGYSEEYTLWTIAPQLTVWQPDFMINLGDVLDFHAFGFNVAPPSPDYTRQAYLNYRRLMRDSIGEAAHFVVIGNWDGENGDFTDGTIAESRAVRSIYAPSPSPETYPEGGSPYGDYYAFKWGDALFCVLNVMTYTSTSHLLTFGAGYADDWTLGDEQLAWFEQTLAQADSKWRFVLIHHAVGGAAGTPEDSAYGRGGGQAAQVGEQALVHELMKQYGVQIFFYGHDHVFTDMVVDDIHYTLPGSAGAPWKFSNVETGYETYWSDSGHGRVHVEPERVQVDLVSINGQTLYSYELE